jgi:DNA-binding NarL/FixJ family response regulator
MTWKTVLLRIQLIVENVGDDCAIKKRSSLRTAINVVLAGSSPMQLQLLTSALRRRPEFNVVSCAFDPDVLLHNIQTASPHVLVFAANASAGSWEDMALLRRLHVAYPKTAQILLVESVNRDLVVNAFRSGVRDCSVLQSHHSDCFASASRLFIGARFGPALSRSTTYSN